MKKQQLTAQLLRSTACIAIATTMHSFGAVAQTDEGEDQTAVLGTVTVTATRRESSLQQTPISLVESISKLSKEMTKELMMSNDRNASFWTRR